MQKEKPINTPNRQEEAPQLPGPYDNLGSDTPLPLPQLGMPGSLEFGASFETQLEKQLEKVNRTLGEVALSSAVFFDDKPIETHISPELEYEDHKLKEYAIENLDNISITGEHKQHILELLNKTNQETLAARRVVETILADDTIVNYLNGDIHQLGGEVEFDYDLVTDVKSGLIGIAKNAGSEDYQSTVDRFSEFFESTNLPYMEAMDSGYPEDLLIKSRLAIFSRYSGNSIPQGKTLVEHNVDMSLKNFNVAKDLGEGGSVLRDVDPGIAKTILQNESYRRDNIENYDYLDSEKCLDIARSIERIKGHDDKAYAQSGLNALRYHMGKGYVSDIHMAEFMNDLISSDKLKHLKEHGTLEIFTRDELRRFEDSKDSENFIRGVEEVIDWCSEAGYDYESNQSDMSFVNDIAFGVSGSSSPQTLVQNFKNLEFIDRLNGNLESSDREKFREEIIADLFGASREWMINNPEIVNETYSLYDHQELKQRNDFRLLLGAKKRINEEFSWLNEDLKTQVSSHFDENYTKYINRTDKDGNRFDSVRSIYQAVDDSYRYRNEKGLNPDTLKWFESSSELPMFAYASVARMRSEAVSHGVEDNPGAVYDFIYSDPEMVSQLSSINRDEYIKSTIVKDYEYVESFLPGAQSDRRISDEEKFNQLKSRCLKEAYSRQESFRTFINLSKDTLEMVSGADMQLKSILDTDVQVDHGDAYNARRSGVEIALGIRSMNSNDPHPIYGSAGFVDRGYPDGAWGYGEVMLVFNDEDMNSRSTFTSADSFHGANRLTREDAMIVRAAKDINKVGHTKTTDYVEAQIRGSVDVMKAEKICVEDYGTADNLRSFLPEELHDRIIVRPVDKNLK